MSDVSDSGFPQRDGRRRIVAVRDFVAVMLAGAVAGAVALVLLDGLFSLLQLGTFGRVNGWLAVILPVMLLVEEFRAWRGTPGRAMVALTCAVLAAGAGLLTAGLAGGLPDLVAGALGATGFSVAYSLLWFYGIRMARGEVVDE